MSVQTTKASVSAIMSGRGVADKCIGKVSQSEEAKMQEPQEPIDEELNVLFIEDDAAVAQMYKLKLELDG